MSLWTTSINVSRESTQQAREWQGGHAAGWTDERVEALKRFWGEGLSASQIAKELGGITRNAVCGKVDRLGLPARRVAHARKRSPFGQNRESGRKPRPLGWDAAEAVAARKARAELLRSRFEVVEIVDLAPEESALAVSFMALNRHTCRWPQGDPRDLDAMRFCGDEPFEGRSYCARHCLMAYVKPDRKIRIPRGA